MAGRKSKMTSLERVHATVKGQPVDRVPFLFWINAHAACKLMTEYKPSRNFYWNMLAGFHWANMKKGDFARAGHLARTWPLIFDSRSHNYANLYGLELGGDILLASFATPNDYTTYFKHGGRYIGYDIFGVLRDVGDGIYADMIVPPIKTIEDVRSYKIGIDLTQPKLYDSFRRFRKTYPNKSIAAEVWAPFDLVNTQLMGTERFMTFVVDYYDEVKKLIDRLGEQFLDVMVRSVKAGADIVFMEDDYGYNRRTLISVKMWKDLVLPYIKKAAQVTHENKAIFALHSCGYQAPLLPYYAEAGVDIVQALQPGAGNDFAEIYAKYAGQMTIATGIDIQLGENMTPEDLRDNMLSFYRTGGRNGRHIMSTTHELQCTMPMENVKMLFRTVKEMQAGKYD